eukprot:m.21877 g.21877  ORF g.21877 m.21877 type:complete len:429 (+) comp5399_c0_seq1:3-1289(+)
MTSMKGGSSDVEVKELKIGEELRCEGSEESPVIIELKKGEAECFGTELAIGRKYAMTQPSMAIYTWHGCTLEICGGKSNAYVSSETNMKTVMNLHAALENLRQIAKKEENGNGPRVLIAGMAGSGRSTLCHILANYSVRMYDTPILVDLDTHNNTFHMPGCVAAAPILRSADPVVGFTHEYPIMYHYGHTSTKKNEKRYEQCMELLATSIEEKFKIDATARCSGIIINTPTCSVDTLIKAATIFNCDTVLVIDTEKLLNELSNGLKKMDKSDVKVILVQKSSGVVPPDEEQRKSLLAQNIKHYFYGFGKEMKLNPHSITLKASRLTVYKIGGREIPLDCLPIGAKQIDFALQLVQMDPSSPELPHKVLSVVDCAQDATHEEVKNACVRGFIVLEEYDSARVCFRISSPDSSFPFSVALLQDTPFIEVV